MGTNFNHPPAWGVVALEESWGTNPKGGQIVPP